MDKRRERSVVMFVNAKAIKQLVKDHKRRCGKDFIQALDRQVHAMIIRAAESVPEKSRVKAGMIV